MSNSVVDLCSSDDDSDGDKFVPHRRILSDTPTGSRRNKHAPIVYGNQQTHSGIINIDDGEDDRKPAARGFASLAGPSARKKPRQEIVDMSLHSSPPSVAARLPSYPQSASRTSFSRRLPVATKVVERPKTPRERVLEVFPDVEINHLKKVLRDCKNAVEMVLGILAERSYPKSKTDGGGGGDGRHMMAPASVLVKRMQVKPKYDYTSASSFEPTAKYIDEACQMLLFDFPFVRVESMRKILKEKQQHFTLARNYIMKILKQGRGTNKKRFADDSELREFQSLKPVWATKLPSQEQKEGIGIQHCMKRFIRRPRPTLTDPILKDEVQYANHQLEKWMEGMEEKRMRHEARKRSECYGNGMECGCCFDKVPIEEMVACRNEGHLFCIDCIQTYADTQIFSNGTLGVVKATGQQACELLCFDGSGCQSGFYEEHLQRSLTVKTLEKYTELQFRASIEAAGLSQEMCSCPKCGFQADLPPNLIIFQCPVEDCRHESCRKCGKAPHIPLRCDEVVQKKRQDEGRLKVEEALAEAKIRKCPKCSTPFVKSDGCNKMTCRCGAKMCYICRKELKGQNPYTHFCQEPHCGHKTCGKCTLYSNAEEDDKRAMREAGLTAAETYRQELQEKEGADPANVDIDVDQIMKSGTSCSTARQGIVAARRRR